MKNSVLDYKWASSEKFWLNEQVQLKLPENWPLDVDPVGSLIRH